MGQAGVNDAVLGFATGSSVGLWFMTSVHGLFSEDRDQDNRFNSDLILGYGPYIDQNRNFLVKAMFQEENLKQKDWLFMVDNDIIFKPEDVWALFAVADEKGPGIYAGAYLQENNVLACGPWVKDQPMRFRHLKGLPIKPMQVGMVAAGFTLIHRDVLEAVGDKPFSVVTDEASEDVAFCWRAREAGYAPWVVPNSSPGHCKQVVLFTDGIRNIVGDRVDLIEVEPETELTRVP